MKRSADVFLTGVRGQETVRDDLQFGGIDCIAANDDQARQEYRLSSDLSYQVQRFGTGRPGVSGEQNFDLLDLTTAFQLVEESQQRWLALPKAIRDRYHSWAAIEAAHATGELAQFVKAAGIEEVPSSVPAAAPSDSAAEVAPKGA